MKNEPLYADLCQQVTRRQQGVAGGVGQLVTPLEDELTGVAWVADSLREGTSHSRVVPVAMEKNAWAAALSKHYPANRLADAEPISAQLGVVLCGVGAAARTRCTPN